MPDHLQPLPEFTFQGQPLRLRGVNLGSWLNLEDFMLGLDGTDWQIRAALHRQLGAGTASAFLDAYRRHFINEADIRHITALGFNSVRLPFNWRSFESEAAPGLYNPAGFDPIDRLFDWCAAAGLAVLLDFHACPGGQSTSPPADHPDGYAQLWGSVHAQDRVTQLWEEFARRYHRHPALLGYNLINEPQTHHPGELTEGEQVAALNRLCHRLIAALRAIDPVGWIVIEGPVRQGGGNALLDPGLFADPRTAATFHHYPLYEDSLGLPGPRLPMGTDATEHRAYLRDQTACELAFGRRIKRPVLLGEFGLSARWEPARAQAIYEAQVTIAEEMGFSWMIWTYKDIWRLGLLNPRPESSWLQFVRSPELLHLRAELDAGLAAFFQQHLGQRLPPRPDVRWLREAAYEDMQRAHNRLILDHQVRQLSQRATAEVVAMAESFALENCVMRPACYAALRPYLSPKAKTPLIPTLLSR